MSLSTFWGNVFTAGSSSLIDTPEGMSLVVTSLAFNGKEGQKVQLFLEVEGLEEEKILFATLRGGKIDQQMCNLRIASDQPTMFTVEGNGEIHASGFLQPDDDEDVYDEDGNNLRYELYPSDEEDEEEEEESDEEEKAAAAKKQAAASAKKKPAAEPKKEEQKQPAKAAPTPKKEEQKKEATKAAPTPKKDEKPAAAKPTPKKEEKPAAKEQKQTPAKAAPTPKKEEQKQAPAKKAAPTPKKEEKPAAKEGDKKRKGGEHSEAPAAKKGDAATGLTCKTCNKSFKSPQGLEDHNLTKHK